MILNYYTPKLMAQYFTGKNYSIEEQYRQINKLYKLDYTYIQPKYKNNKKLFKINTQEEIEYLLDTNNYLNTEKIIQKDYQELGINYTNKITPEKIIDYYFLTVRLDRILKNQPYTRKKLRTLLNTYGYKRKSNKIITHIQNCLTFYHITASINKKPLNTLEIDIDKMITFTVKDYEDVDLKSKKLKEDNSLDQTKK